MERARRRSRRRGGVGENFIEKPTRLFSRLNHTCGGCHGDILSAGQDGDGFDVGGLGEEVEEMELGACVAGGAQDCQGGWEGFGRAGDVDERGRGDPGEERADFGAGSGAGWVEDDEVGALALYDGGAEEVERGGTDRAEVRELGGGERGGGGFGDLDCGDLREAAGQHAGEEADASVEVPCQLAGAVRCDQREEFGQQEAVDLEEGSAWNPVSGCWLLVVG